MAPCARSGDLWAAWRSSQLTEIAPFRLTRPFDLAYTRFTACFGEFLAMGRRCFSADADGSSLIIISRR
jgi:hypothetical protein